MREWIKALPLTVGLPVVIGVASVKPEDAASNIAAWIEFIGFHNLPHWLTSPHADQHVIAGACFAAAVYSFAIWGPHRKKRTTIMNTWGPWALIVGSPILGIIWLYLATPQSMTAKVAQMSAQAPAAAAVPAIDPSIPETLEQLFRSDFADIYPLNMYAKFGTCSPTTTRPAGRRRADECTQIPGSKTSFRRPACGTSLNGCRQLVHLP